MNYWVLHFEHYNEDGSRNEVVRNYPQCFYKKWENVINMMDKEREKGNPFLNKWAFNGKCALIDIDKQKQKLASEIGKLIYN